MTPRLGFLGVGWIGRHRMQMIAESGVAEVTMIADSSLEIMNESKKHFPQAQFTTNYDEMLGAHLDGIVIATPSALHAEQAIRALETGKAAFCQKPLGRSALETQKVVECARRVNRLLEMDLSYRYTLGMQKVRNLILEGDVGTIFSVELVFHNAYGPDKAWFYNPALSGGGCVMDLGIHLVDLALWSLEFPQVETVTSRLFSRGKLLKQIKDQVEDYAVARIDLSTNVCIQLACSWKLSAGCDCIISATFYGTKGSLSFKNVNGSFYDFMVERCRGTSREILIQPPDPWGGRAAVEWAKRLTFGNHYQNQAEEFIWVAKILDEIYGRQEISG